MHLLLGRCRIIRTILEQTLFFYQEVAVYLLFGLAIAGLLYVLFPENLIRRHLGKRSFLSVLKSTAVGIPLPLCSCGVIPVAASLRRSGASKGAVISFLVSTPQIGADSFLITYSLLGSVFAVFRITAAFLTALIVGFFVNFADRKEPDAGASFSKNEVLPQETFKERLRNLPSYVEYSVLGPIANSLILGIVLAGLISALIPGWVFERYFSNHWVSMLFMMAVGIPMYVCASASTPIAASLVFKGISPGSALVFLLTGPATNAVTIATVSKSLGKRAAAIYLAGIAAVSLLMGVALDLLADRLGVREAIRNNGGHTMLPLHWLRAGAFLLLFMLIWYYIKVKIIDRLRAGREGLMLKERMTLTVDGMTCMHCVATVKKAAASIPGIHDITVDLDTKKVQFMSDGPDLQKEVVKAIEKAGYDVRN